MGVRGLTSYIAQRAEQYLMPYELHDCNLVIDGDNLACNLYKDVTGTYSAFGGDYDDFYRAVVQFFKVLSECNIQPFVLCDGGYEARKLRTVATRLRGKITVIKRINPHGSVPIFPVMMKEVFVDAVRDCGIPLMRCVFEADDELAALGRKLKCPVLSYDSDFYIFNGTYIPLVTLTVKAHTKIKKNTEKKDNQETRQLRKNEARHVEKRMKAHRIVDKICVGNDDKSGNLSDSQKEKRRSYKYLDCCIYRIEHLISRRALSKEKLPLFAALLGNDYIARSSFNYFFRVGLGKAGRSRKMKQQQRRIRVILEWLKNESVETALQKVLTRLKKEQRESLKAQVAAAISGYSNEQCISYDFFAKNFENALNRYPPQYNLVDDDEETGDCEEWEDCSDCSNEEYFEEEETEITSEKEMLDSIESTENVSEEEKNDEDIATDDEENDDIVDKLLHFPKWFLEKLYPAKLPRFFVDLIHLRKYINSPQIEHFPYNDCNEVALPILIYIFTLLNSVEGEKKTFRYAEDGTILPTEFVYLTRTIRITNIVYKHLAMEPDLIKYPFNPQSPNPLLLRQAFQCTPHLDVDKLFQQTDILPTSLRLYFLAIVFWLHRSQHYDFIHLHSLILCAVVLQVIDTKIPAERDLKAFQKRFGKIVKTERLVRDKEALKGIKRGIKQELQYLSIPDRMVFIPKSDCYLVQNNLLQHFHMQEIFKKKYDHYSTTVLHGFSEFQSVVFQLNALNALLDFPYESSHMGQLYCGVFIYNLYDLLKNRSDLKYYIENFLLQDSKLMFDYYEFLYNWCDQFTPHWKRISAETTSLVKTVGKKALKKQRQIARKKASLQNTQILFDSNTNVTGENHLGEDEFVDLNNKFSTLLKVG